MTVAVCLVVALRISDLRATDMIEKLKVNGLLVNGCASPVVPGRVVSPRSASPRIALDCHQDYLSLDSTAMENDTARSSENSLENTSEVAAVVLSKKAQKRALKMARLEERKIERRAKERAAKKEKKRKRAERLAAGEQLSDDERLKRTKADRAKEPFAARVVLDLGFDDKMNDKVRGAFMYHSMSQRDLGHSRK